MAKKYGIISEDAYSSALKDMQKYSKMQDTNKLSEADKIEKNRCNNIITLYTKQTAVINIIDINEDDDNLSDISDD